MLHLQMIEEFAPFTRHRDLKGLHFHLLPSRQRGRCEQFRGSPLAAQKIADEPYDVENGGLARAVGTQEKSQWAEFYFEVDQGPEVAYVESLDHTFPYAKSRPRTNRGDAVLHSEGIILSWRQLAQAECSCGPEHAGQFDAARAHVVDVRPCAAVPVLERALLLRLAPEDLVVAVAVERRQAAARAGVRLTVGLVAARLRTMTVVYPRRCVAPIPGGTRQTAVPRYFVLAISDGLL